MDTPQTLKTFRIRGMSQVKATIEGLVNHRQWFTFRPLRDTHYPDALYELDLDAETPESGYGFIPTSDPEEFDAETGFGLLLSYRGDVSTESPPTRANAARTPRRMLVVPTGNPPFAAAGSQRWLQIGVALAPELLDAALRRCGAIEVDDGIQWKSPIAADQFAECRDQEVLRRLSINSLPRRSLTEFWPQRGPVWDALGISSKGRLILVEAKAHIPEAVSPPSKASVDSLAFICRSLQEARKHYAPRATADWTTTFYQYANRLAFQYLFSHLNGLPARLIFLNFCNASDVEGPESEEEWRGATRLLHAQLGLPEDLTDHGVFHAYVDVRLLPLAT